MGENFVLIPDGQEDETQHLFDDPTSMHYGSFEQQHMNGQEDPQEVQREIEALQQVVARTSKYVPLQSRCSTLDPGHPDPRGARHRPPGT